MRFKQFIIISFTTLFTIGCAAWQQPCDCQLEKAEIRAEFGEPETIMSHEASSFQFDIWTWTTIGDSSTVIHTVTFMPCAPSVSAAALGLSGIAKSCNITRSCTSFYYNTDTK